MNIRIEQQTARKTRNGFADYALPIFTQRFGVISVVLLVMLFLAETYYRNVLHDDKAIYIGGFGSGFGLLLIIRAAFSANASWERYKNHFAVKPEMHRYVALTDDYVENGVEGLWHQRFDWRMLTGFKEQSSRFLLELGLTQIVLDKRDLKNEQLLTDIRAFLDSRLAMAKAE